MNDRGLGRKPNAPEDQTKPRSVRLNDARWDQLKRLGSSWLCAQIDAAQKKEKQRIAKDSNDGASLRFYSSTDADRCGKI